jgi:hypothetical protein
LVHVGGADIVPFHAGEELTWRLESTL